MRKKLNIDFWRFIAAFFIVAIHISPFEKISPTFDFFFTRVLGRIAVPLFLMITAYFIMDKALEDENILKNYTKKILKIYFFCIVLYLPINIYMGMFKNFSFIAFIKDIFINGTMYHLWYFPALIVGIWLLYFLLKKFGSKITFLLSVLFYLIGLFGDSYYGIVLLSNTLSSIYDFFFLFFDYTRNGLFFVPLFLYLGYFVKKNTYYHSYSLGYSFFFFLCMSIEAFLLHHYAIQRHDSMYLFLPFLMYFLFSYMIHTNISSNKTLRSIATIIYIFHPFFIVFIRFFSKIIGMEEILVHNHLIFYFVVSLATLLFAFVVEKIGLVFQNKLYKESVV